MFPHPPFPDHALVDSGGGEKLERFGRFVLRRPDPQALWRPRSPAAWERADLVFERDPASGGKRGRWRAGPRVRSEASPGGRAPAEDDLHWTVGWGAVRCVVRPTPFKHVGLFPEQAANWAWIERVGAALVAGEGVEGGDRAPALLNLFGYTGTASLVAVRAGFRVTHVDASRAALAWTKENLAASGIAPDALRLVLEDATAFVRREVRRGSRYAGILLDPPHYGRGPKGEKWQFEEHVADLVTECEKLLEPRAFLVISTYAIGFSSIALANLLGSFGGGRVVAGELALPEEPVEGAPARLLPAGSCARLARELEVD